MALVCRRSWLIWVRHPVCFGSVRVQDPSTLSEPVDLSPEKQRMLATPVIDDLSENFPIASIGTSWRLFTDSVMGGVSHGTLARDIVAGRAAIRIRGAVSLENNGGFVEMSLDLAADSGAIDASAWRGVELDVIGNGQEYNIHLRTEGLTRPWQSYRQGFKAVDQWQRIDLGFESFLPHRTDIPLDTRRLRRLGIVAIGRMFTVDLAVGGVRYLA